MPNENGELTVDDVEQYTKGRLVAGNPETERILDAALDAARRFCGWHVTPVITDEVTLDGPGGHVLSLPTMRLVELTELSEDGTALNVDDLAVSPRGLVQKRCGRWSHNYGSITAKMKHGYDEATDFQAAVLELVDRMASQVGKVIGNSGPPVEERVDDVVMRWVLTISSNHDLFDMLNHTLLDRYRLLAFA
ncbi:hypothetical protein MSP7336_01804 [Mycobacterium shimoidei]|uniref:Head-to-tail adaptor n=1 Tax=Mycobacterium shimoidei TaxID=29313 RepID=A0A375YXT3_MYCSH|nr:hypothetical protein [Mycobacterium shimoidei]SRX93565.1 hypothetical protein MSP7336_01804 [Mycobacterium shimoidei]